MIDGVLIVDWITIANWFNEYFVTIANKLNSERSPVLSNEHEVEQIFSQFTNGKASDFPIHVIKKVSPIITPVLTAQFNSLMEDGTYPHHAWRQVKSHPYNIKR